MSILTMTEAEYRAINAISQSDLVMLSKSPQHYKQGFVEQTEAMKLGTVLHLARFEPRRFHEQILIEPETIGGEKVNKRLKAHRDFLKMFHEQNKEKIILTSTQFENTMGMLNALANNQDVVNLFQVGEPEATRTWRWNDHDCKGRADWIGVDANGKRYGVDLKKTQSARKDDFERTIWNRMYYLQAWWYCHGFELDYFLFIAIDERAPHGIGIYKADTTMLEAGEKKAKSLIKKLDECEKEQNFHSYTKGIETVFLPAWTASQFGLEETENE